MHGCRAGIDADILARMVELVGGRRHRLLYRPQNPFLAGFTRRRGHRQRRTYRDFQRPIGLGKLLDRDDSRTAAILAQRGLQHDGTPQRIRDLLSGSALLGQPHHVYRNLGKKGLFLMTLLQGLQPRARWMRLGTAEILKRFYFCERSLVIGCSAWLPLIGAIEAKTLLPLFSWQNAQTANDLRERIFELRYPSRSMEEEGADRALVELFDELRNSPSAAAFFSVLATVLLPAVRDAYAEFLHHSDPLADAPTHRFLHLALTEKHQQIETVKAWADEELARRPMDRAGAEAWTAAFLERLSALGGVGTERVPVDLGHESLPGARPYAVPN